MSNGYDHTVSNCYAHTPRIFTGFYHTLDAYTEDNECLVVDTSPENHVTPDEMMRWWRAVDPGPFQMGSREY
jgi:hypothetical protein